MDKHLKTLPKETIPEFYAGRSVFITGATGFMGKVLIEKLLRSCPDVSEIFLLMRAKKNMTIDQRVQKMITLPLFEKLREDMPSAFKKLIPVTGDTSEEGLGLRPVERQVIIERVSVMFHVAASVRFDDSMRDAVLQNVRSTRDLCILGAQMKKLAALVHVSSTYCHVDKPTVEEKMYPKEFNWKEMIRLANEMDDNVLRALTSKILGPFPNTYTFTKRLAEEVIDEYSSVIPCVIFRPSIVISTLDDPMKGWVDNFNGPVGLMVGGAKGVLRTLYLNPEVNLDFMPVDVAIRAMISSAWRRGSAPLKRDSSVHVYNCSTSNIKSITTQALIYMGLRYSRKYPVEGILWAPNVIVTFNKAFYYLLWILLHLIPGLVVDAVLLISGYKPMLLKVYKKVFTASQALEHFLVNEWKFRNENFLSLCTDLTPADYAKFGHSYNDVDIEMYFKESLFGAKKYLLNEDMENMPSARKHQNRLYMIHNFLKGWLLLYIGWAVLKYFEIF